MAAEVRVPTITVLAGVNGAGKSSVAGEWLRGRGFEYFNPDEATRQIQADTRSSLEQANAQAWLEGKERLEAAIRNRTDFAFESTLAGNTMPRLLMEAAEQGFKITVWFVGLSSPEHHLARVRARVAAGGHDIPESKIRERWNASRRNIVELLPHLTELRVFDNSAERDPVTGAIPPPREVLHWRRGKVIAHEKAAPEWARPIVSRALELSTTA
jgi:predicted ABC-type ATPase